MKIKAIIQRKSSDTKTEQVQHEFNIGKFQHSKLRFLTFNDEEPIKLSPKEMSYLKC
jgi:DNA-binding response OmpR family regulator